MPPNQRLQQAGERWYARCARFCRCVPTVFVDRMRMPGTGALDSFLPPDFVAAVEVYGAGFAHAEFQDNFSGCGTIVVWTGARR